MAEPTRNTARKTAKKTASKPAKKTAKKTARKTTSKTASKSTGTSRAASSRETGDGRRTAATTQSRRSNASATGSSNGSRPSTSPLKVATIAAEQLAQLTGKPPEGVVGIEREEDEWVVEIEVLELRRVPSTTDVLARYRVTADKEGELTGYRRLRRYSRGAAGEE